MVIILLLLSSLIIINMNACNEQVEGLPARDAEGESDEAVAPGDAAQPALREALPGRGAAAAGASAGRAGGRERAGIFYR